MCHGTRSDDPDLPPDEAYVMGLLHDIGRFVMVQEAPARLRAIDEGDWDTPEALVAEELEVCGLTHAALGAAACSKWGLPAMVGEVIERHHDPIDTPHDPVEKLTVLVQFADLAMFPSAMPGTPGMEEASDADLERELLARMPGFLDLGVTELRDLLTRTAEEADAASEALGLAA